MSGVEPYFPIFVMGYQLQLNSVVTNSVVNEHSVITNSFWIQIGHFSAQINPFITNPSYNEQKMAGPEVFVTEFIKYNNKSRGLSILINFDQRKSENKPDLNNSDWKLMIKNI